MLLKPWYDIVKPRNELCDASVLDTLQFTIDLEKVFEGQTLAEYSHPADFFTHTYLTTSLTHLASQVLWRLAENSPDANAVFHVTGHKGEGKTHALTLLYHLIQHGVDAHKWMGIQKILALAGVSSIPQVHTAVVAGTAFDTGKGRRNKRTEPLRKTPWGEIAFQLGGKEAYNTIVEYDERMIAPEDDILRMLLVQGTPCLLLIDDFIEYAVRHRSQGMIEQGYHFLQQLTEHVKDIENVALVVSLPGKESGLDQDMTAAIERYENFLNQASQPVPVASDNELPEIIRRRLFQWDPSVISPEGNVTLSDEALETCASYARWIRTNRLQLPEWFPFEQAEQMFIDTYPFHPAVFSMFIRKWQILPHFQYTRGILRLLACWIASAHQDGYSKVYSDPLISLGTAPLEDLDFRNVVREQLGDDKRLKTPIFTDIVGRDAFAVRLDAEAADDIKHDRLHQKTATVIFFESNGGIASPDPVEASEPEIRFAVGEPAMKIENVTAVLDALIEHCHYLTRENKLYRFHLAPNLNKLFIDRSPHLDEERLEEQLRAEISELFATSPLVTLFPEESHEILDHPVLTLVVMAPEYTSDDPQTLHVLQAMTETCGEEPRTFQNAIIWVVPDQNRSMYGHTRSILTWRDIQHDLEAGSISFEDSSNVEPASMMEQITVNINNAHQQLREAVWQNYRQMAFLNKESHVEFLDLGQFQPDESNSQPLLLLHQLRLFDYVVDTVSPRFLTRNWPEKFKEKEWSTRAVRDMFFISPLFPRLLNPDILKETIAKGASSGLLGYVSRKVARRYDIFYYQKPLMAADVEISDEKFIITPETAEAYLAGLTPTLTSLTIDPPQVNLTTGEKITFTAHALDETGEEIKRNVQWEATGGTIDQKGIFIAGENDGSDFEVRATAGEKNAWVKVSILSKKPDPPDQLVHQLAPVEERPETPLSIHVSWEGDISARAQSEQAWLDFYHTLLAPLSQHYSLNVELRLDISLEQGITAEQIEKLKTALRKLNLPEDLQKY